jgi:hypothetical protein
MPRDPMAIPDEVDFIYDVMQEMLEEEPFECEECGHTATTVDAEVSGFFSERGPDWWAWKASMSVLCPSCKERGAITVTDERMPY